MRSGFNDLCAACPQLRDDRPVVWSGRRLENVNLCYFSRFEGLPFAVFGPRHEVGVFRERTRRGVLQIRDGILVLPVDPLRVILSVKFQTHLYPLQKPPDSRGWLLLPLSSSLPEAQGAWDSGKIVPRFSRRKLITVKPVRRRPGEL